ncbi:MAG: thiamine pyrophosphate-dependent enzyme [Bacillota bacterium]
MEYDTAMRYNIPFTTVILNDRCWGMIKRSEASKSSSDKEFIGLDLCLVRYEKIVEVFGGHGEFVTRPQDIGGSTGQGVSIGQTGLRQCGDRCECGPSLSLISCCSLFCHG